MSDTRKLQKTGGSTYVLSLPKKWVLRELLDKGSTLTIKEQKDGSLLLIPGEREEMQPKETELFDEENIERRLIEKYLVGYDILHINSKIKFSAKQKSDIKKIVKNLIGFEIINESSKSITVKYLLDSEEVSVFKSLRRMYTIVSVMHKDLTEALTKADRSLLKDVIQRDHEVDRLYFLVVRQIRTLTQNPPLREKEGISALDCVDYRLVSKIIELLGDGLTKIANSLLDEKNLRKYKPLKELAESTYEVHKKASEALFKRDEKIAVEVQALRAKVKPTSLKEKNQTAFYITNQFLRIADSGEDLADIVVGE